jgi:hypothetical protein
MKIILLIVAVLAGFAALVQVPEFLQLFAPETPQNLFTTIRQRVLLHDIGIAAAIALAAGFGAAVLHRMEPQATSASGAAPPPAPARPQREHPAIDPDPSAQSRRRCPSCNTMVQLNRTQCWSCGHVFVLSDSPLARLIPMASPPVATPARPAADLACAGCGRKRDAEARFCAGCGRKFPGAT